MSNGNESNEGEIFSLANVLRNGFRELMKGIHTMLPGVIDSFNPATQRAQVSLATAQETVEGKKVSFPVLINVPVQFFRWGSFSMTAPINKGDECCVIFSERSMDLFLQQGGVDKVPNDARFFDLADAFAIPALNSDANIVPDYDPSNLVIKHDDGTVKITLTPEGEMKVEADKDITLKSKENINLQAGDGIGNAVKLFKEGFITSTNSTAELVTVLHEMLALIDLNTVQPGWLPQPKQLYAAELVKLKTFLGV